MCLYVWGNQVEEEKEGPLAQKLAPTQGFSYACNPVLTYLEVLRGHVRDSSQPAVLS